KMSRAMPGTLEGRFNERLAIRTADMPPRYHRLARWIIENRYRAPFLSTNVAREETGIMQHECVDFAKRLGYKGWPDLKEALLAELVRDMAIYYGDLRKTEIARRIYQNLNRKRGYEE